MKTTQKFQSKNKGRKLLPKKRKPIEKTSSSERNEKAIAQPTINVVVPERKERWTIANILNLTGLIVAGLVLLLNYALFKETSIQAGQAIESNKLALSEYKANRDRDRTEDSVANIRDSLTRRALFLQLETITESRRQFEIQNRPLIIVDSLIIGNELITGGRIRSTFHLKNWGRVPAKILEVKHALTWDMSTEKLRIDWPENPNYKVNVILPFDRSYRHTNKSKEVWSMAHYDELLNGVHYYYVFLEVTYLDLITGKKFLFRYVTRNIDPRKGTGNFELINETIELN